MCSYFTTFMDWGKNYVPHNYPNTIDLNQSVQPSGNLPPVWEGQTFADVVFLHTDAVPHTILDQALGLKRRKSTLTMKENYSRFNQSIKEQRSWCVEKINMVYMYVYTCTHRIVYHVSNWFSGDCFWEILISLRHSTS